MTIVFWATVVLVILMFLVDCMFLVDYMFSAMHKWEYFDAGPESVRRCTICGRSEESVISYASFSGNASVAWEPVVVGNLFRHISGKSISNFEEQE